jgi:hypothetical protein
MVKIKYAAEKRIVSRRAEAWNTPYNPIAGVMVNMATLNQRTPLIAGNPLRTVVPIVAPGSDVEGSSAVALFFKCGRRRELECELQKNIGNYHFL